MFSFLFVLLRLYKPAFCPFFSSLPLCIVVSSTHENNNQDRVFSFLLLFPLILQLVASSTSLIFSSSSKQTTMSTEACPKTSAAQPLQEQQQQQRQQHQNTALTYGSNEEILTKLKNLGLEDQLSLSLLAKFKELRLQDRPYFSPPVRPLPPTQHFILTIRQPTIHSTIAERAKAWSSEYCGH